MLPSPSPGINSRILGESGPGPAVEDGAPAGRGTGSMAIAPGLPELETPPTRFFSSCPEETGHKWSLKPGEGVFLSMPPGQELTHSCYRRCCHLPQARVTKKTKKQVAATWGGGARAICLQGCSTVSCPWSWKQPHTMSYRQA